MARSIRGSTALHVACHGGHSGVVMKLLAAGADLSLLCTNGESALYIATAQNNLSLVSLLLPFRPPINTPVAPLFIAAKNGNLPMVRQLIEHGAFINAKTAHGDFPLLTACQHSHLSVLKFFLSFTPKQPRRQPIKKAAEFPFPHANLRIHHTRSKSDSLVDEDEVSKMKLDVNVIREEDGRNAMLIACTQSNVPIVRLLMAYLKCDQSSNGELPLLLSIAYNQLNVFQFLLYE